MSTRTVVTFITYFYVFSLSLGTEGRLRVKRNDTDSKYVNLQDNDNETTTFSNEDSEQCIPKYIIDENEIEEDDLTLLINKTDLHSPLSNLSTTITAATETFEELGDFTFSSEFINCPTPYIMLEAGCFQTIGSIVYVPFYDSIFEETFYNIRNGSLILCHEETIDYSLYSDEFMDCSAPYIDIQPGDFERNGSDVYVPKYDRTFDETNYMIKYGYILVCPDFFKYHTDDEKFSWTLPYVSIACVSISASCIIAHLIMFALVLRLRNLPGYVLASLCVALLSAYVCNFIQFNRIDQKHCRTVGMFLVYFFLSSFFWMNTMSYDVWRSIRMATCKLRLTANRSVIVRFARYSLYAWGMPLIIIIISIIVHNTTSVVQYQLVFDPSNCWFKYKRALTMYFAVPFFALLAMNTFFFISSFVMISRATMNKSQSTNKTDLRSRLFLSFRLCSVMGFTWILAIIATATQQMWLYYLSAFCNSLQGLFIFFSFTVSETARKACRWAMKSRKGSVIPTQTSLPSSHVSCHPTAVSAI